jgi:hypothetical protein
LTIIAAALLAVAADPARISAARCQKTFVRETASQFIGQASWQDQADGTIVGSTENRTVGRLLMTCRIKLPSKATSAILDFRGAHISFTGSKSAGGGLEIAVYKAKSSPACVLSGTRVSREDWIELGVAEYPLEFDTPVDRVTLAFTLSDMSDAGSVRADVNPTSIRLRRPGENVQACPPAVR